jgi:hypothetical protein
MSLIAADIEKPPATIFPYLLRHGGIEPRTRSRRPVACHSMSESSYRLVWLAGAVEARCQSSYSGAVLDLAGDSQERRS